MRISKNVLQHLKSVYYSLVHSHMTYGCLLWGNALQKHLRPLQILQNKALRLIAGSTYNEQTNTLYKKLKIAKLCRMFKLQIIKLMFMIREGWAPKSQKQYFVTNQEIHNYNTQHSSDFHFPMVKCKSVTSSIVFTIYYYTAWY